MNEKSGLSFEKFKKEIEYIFGELEINQSVELRKLYKKIKTCDQSKLNQMKG